MTKGELEAYATVCGGLRTLISTVEYYCKSYGNRELLSACSEARESLEYANKIFNKGKRKK